MKEIALKLANEWVNNPLIEDSDKSDIRELLSKNEEKELIERFGHPIEFGTGGVRAVLGNGTSRLNKYTVRKATQAMCNVLLTENHDKPSACISYDSRHFSFEFSKEVASVFAANGIKAYIFSVLTPTPMLSYAIRFHKSHCGVMITASHNPPEYNGYKAYWGDGGQVVPPVDNQVISNFNGIDNLADVKSCDFDAAMKDGMIEWIKDECNESFYKIVEAVSPRPELCLEKGKNIKIIYTPLHGTGKISIEEISNRMGFTNIITVPEQGEPDPDFTTVKFPNPEEPEALKMAVDLMLKENADVVYGTDPDADRLGVVVNVDGKPEYLNGNQIAVIMLHYILNSRKELGTLPAVPFVVKSVVTSEMQTTLVEAFNGKMVNTLTGFKWMCGAMNDLDKKGEKYDFVFASEESFGYMTHNQARDKDSVGSVAIMSEIVLYYKEQGKNLIEALDEIYTEYGFYYESLIAQVYKGADGKEKINRIMESFRKYSDASICNDEIISMDDIKSGFSTNIKTGNKTPIDLPSSNVLSFTFESGTKLFLRPSGTEPKIKFYIMVREADGDLVTKKDNAFKKINFFEEFIKTMTEKA
jgi:phosphoglucomutase